MLSLIVSKILEKQESQKRDNYDLKCLLQEKKQTETALNNLVSALEKGICSSTTNKRLHELEEKLECLEREIIIAKSKESATITDKEIKAFFVDTIKLERKAIINQLVNKIELYDDKMTIYYNMPNSNISPDESQGFCFYIKEKDGFKIEMLI